MKRYLLEKGLRAKNDFRKEVGIEMSLTLDTFLLKAQTYIKFKEKEAARSA